MDTTTRPSLEELRLAYRAAARGDFGEARTAAPGPAAGSYGQTWDPAGPVVVVLGCHGGAGASTVAAALATAHPGPARVVECCAATASAFCAASSAELGRSEGGWVVGRRGDVRIERGGGLPLRAEDVPVPDPAQADVQLTVLDVTWEPRGLHRSSCWLARTVFTAPRPVLVTAATVPGMRHLEAVLHLLEDHARPVVVVRGPARRRGRWAPPVERQVGSRTGRLRQEGHVLPFPDERHLAMNGLDTDPLPAPVVDAAAHVLQVTRTGRDGPGTGTKETNR